MLMRRFPAILILLLALCLGAAAYNARIVRLSLAQGEVELDRNVGQGFERAIVNTPITSGMRLDTTEDARAEVEFENGGTVRLAGPASISFRELSMTGDGDKVTNIDVGYGIVYLDIHHKGDDRFVVNVLGESLTLDKSAHLRIVADEQTATVAVFNGEAWVSGGGERATIKKNETLTLEAEDPGRYFLSKNLGSLPEDQWDRSRENERDQYANNSGYQYSNTAYGAPYSYGINDMLQYGTYFNAPGYGWLWRPSMFDASWDPFSSGMWSYYPGYGYIFVSQYPWGWTPYRYGRWVFVNGRGWCWSPQGGYSNWNVMPVVIHPPRGWVPLHRPTGRGGPALFVHDRRQPPRSDPNHYIANRPRRDVGPRNVGGPAAHDPREHETRDRGRMPGMGKQPPAAGTPNGAAPSGAVTRQQPSPREHAPDARDGWRVDSSQGVETWRRPAKDEKPAAGAGIRAERDADTDDGRRLDRSAPPTPGLRVERPAPQQPVRVDPARPAPQQVPQPSSQSATPSPRVERERPAPQQPVRVEPARPVPLPAPYREPPTPSPRLERENLPSQRPMRVEPVEPARPAPAAPRAEPARPAPAPAPRVEPSRPAPTPRAEPSRPSPRAEAPRMDFSNSSPRMDSPRISSPGMRGGGASGGHGGGRVR